MIGSYTKDSLINIISYDIDEFGVKVENIQENVKCKIFDYNKLVLGQSGQEVMGNMCIFMDKNINIDYTSFVKIGEKDRQIFNDSDKNWKVLQINRLGMFSRRVTEVIIGS